MRGNLGWKLVLGSSAAHTDWLASFYGQERLRLDVAVLRKEMYGHAINALNGMHIRSRQGYSELAARIASYDLAYQLQSTAPEALGGFL